MVTVFKIEDVLFKFWEMPSLLPPHPLSLHSILNSPCYWHRNGAKLAFFLLKFVFKAALKTIEIRIESPQRVYYMFSLLFKRYHYKQKHTMIVFLLFIYLFDFSHHERPGEFQKNRKKWNVFYVWSWRISNYLDSPRSNHNVGKRKKLLRIYKDF